MCMPYHGLRDDCCLAFEDQDIGLGVGWLAHIEALWTGCMDFPTYVYPFLLHD